MAVLYSANLLVRGRGSNEPASLEDLAPVVAQWAGISDPWSSEEMVGRRQARVRTELLGPDAEGRRVWRLEYAHPDTRDQAFRWTVSVTAIQDSETEVAVRLDRTRTKRTVVPPRETPAPPGCLAAILESDQVDAIDSGRALSTHVWVISENEAVPLAELILSPQRRLPIIGFTPRDEDVFDGGALLERIVGIAHVALIQSAATWKLDTLLPSGFNVYGGAVRIWWPGIGPESTRWDHKLWPGDVPARRIADDIVTMTVEAALATGGIDDRVTRLERLRRDRELQSLRSDIASLQDQYHAALEARRQDESSERPELAETGRRLVDAENTLVAAMTADLDEFQALADDYARENDQLRIRAGSAERERDYLRSECSRLRQLVPSGPLSEDESLASLIAEIREEVASRGEVDGARARPFNLLPQFGLTIDAHGARLRPKIVRACADVVIGAPSLLGRRDDHSLRTGEGANDPVRLRSSDGAEARRCYVEHKTPAARRLHYWSTPDGSIQLASVNVHDDMNIPE